VEKREDSGDDGRVRKTPKLAAVDCLGVETAAELVSKHDIWGFAEVFGAKHIDG
jgi:hypothetical protein